MSKVLPSIKFIISGEDYYRLNDDTITVKVGYPRKIAPVWSKCQAISAESQTATGSAIKVVDSNSMLLMAVATVIISLLF